MKQEELSSGVLLSEEQSVRLAIRDSVSRDHLIEAIVRRLRRSVVNAKGARGQNTPKYWYSGKP